MEFKFKIGERVLNRATPGEGTVVKIELTDKKYQCLDVDKSNK